MPPALPAAPLSDGVLSATTWFALGDLDIATHLVRTEMLDAGYPLSDVTAAVARAQEGLHLVGGEALAGLDGRLAGDHVQDVLQDGVGRGVEG